MRTEGEEMERTGNCKSGENYKHLVLKEQRFAEITESRTEILSLFRRRKSRELTDKKINQINLICGDGDGRVTTLNRPNPDHQLDRVSSEKSRAVSVCLIIRSTGRALSLLSE